MIEISHPNAERFREVLELAFGHLPEAELPVRVDAVLTQFGLGAVSLDDVFQATENGQLTGALFSQTRPDGSVVLWPPKVFDTKMERPLFDAFEKRCREKRTQYAVMLCDLQQQVEPAPMKERSGFDFISDLVYLVCQPTGDGSESDQQLEFVPMRNENESDFVRMVELVRETYRNTKDFPQLIGVTPTDEVLEGYKFGSVFRPELWFFIRKEGDDIGSLLLTDQPDTQMELTYMGLVEEHRGFRFSNGIVDFAKRTAIAWNRPFLLTSVDEQNTAAVRAYLGCGFVAWDRKKVFARFFND